MFIRYFILSAILIAIISCSTMRDFNAINGEEAQIRLNDNNVTEGELLFLRGNSLFYLETEIKTAPNNSYTYIFTIKKLFTKNIHSVKINGLSNYAWIRGVVAFQLVPNLLMAIAYNSVNPGGFWEFFGYGMIPVAVTTGLFLMSTPPKPEIDCRSNIAIDSALAPYCRYPKGISDEQFIKFIKTYRQDSVLQADSYLK